MRIGYFGGSFDPPHCGHLAVAHAAVAMFGLEEILFVPTARQPLKPSGPAATFADRLAMVSLLCADDARFVASALEAPRQDGRPNYTVETLTHLRDTLTAKDQLFLLLGADAFVDLPRWRDPVGVLDLAELVILSRPGARLEEPDLPLSVEQRARIHLLGALDDATASTTTREQIAAGASDDELLRWLPAKVLEYIRTHRLYTR